MTTPLASLECPLCGRSEPVVSSVDPTSGRVVLACPPPCGDRWDVEVAEPDLPEVRRLGFQLIRAGRALEWKPQALGAGHQQVQVLIGRVEGWHRRVLELVVESAERQGVA